MPHLPLKRAKPLYEQAYEALRDAIIRGDLEPGRRLVEAELARMLHISRTPVREALRKLEQDGLVRLDDGQAEVFDPSPEDVYALYSCRAAVEGQAAYLAALHRTDGELAALAAVHAELEAAYEAGDLARVLELNTAFHDRVVAMSRNPWLLRLSQLLRVYVLYVRTFNLAQHGQRDLVVTQHASVIEALSKGDAHAARQAMEAHIVANRDAAVERLRDFLGRRGQTEGREVPS